MESRAQDLPRRLVKVTGKYNSIGLLPQMSSSNQIGNPIGLDFSLKRLRAQIVLEILAYSLKCKDKDP
ncbi:hypothetical protein ACLOJK_001294 [Asimina triloba]